MPATNVLALTLLGAIGIHAIPLSSITSRQDPVVYKCPDSDGETYTAANDLNFVVACGKDQQSANLGAEHVDDFEACIALCSTTTNCKGVAFDKGAGDDGWCYLKDLWSNPASVERVWGAYLAEDTDDEQEPTPPTLTCPNPAEPTYTAADGSLFKIECMVDHLGGDLDFAYTASLDACIDLCASTSGCVDVSYVPGNPTGPCYLKDAVNTRADNNNVWGALDVTPPAGAPSECAAVISDPDALACPETVDSMCYYSSASSTYFAVECFQDRYGSDLSLAWTPTYAECLNTCAATEGCLSVAWVPHPGNNGPCYLKYESTQEAHPNGDVWGARVIDAPATPTV